MTTENEIRASLLLSRMPGLTQPQARALLQYYCLLYTSPSPRD